MVWEVSAMALADVATGTAAELTGVGVEGLVVERAG